jgi:hypothetical protein
MTVRPTSTEIISAFRATSVVDTPMRKVEVLEGVDGSVIVRAIEFRAARADVFAIHLQNHEAQTLSEVLRKLGDSAESRKKR